MLSAALFLLGTTPLMLVFAVVWVFVVMDSRAVSESGLLTVWQLSICVNWVVTMVAVFMLLHGQGCLKKE